jgi:hypothetical protein
MPMRWRVPSPSLMELSQVDTLCVLELRWRNAATHNEVAIIQMRFVN